MVHTKRLLKGKQRGYNVPAKVPTNRGLQSFKSMKGSMQLFLDLEKSLFSHDYMTWPPQATLAPSRMEFRFHSVVGPRDTRTVTSSVEVVVECTSTGDGGHEGWGSVGFVRKWGAYRGRTSSIHVLDSQKLEFYTFCELSVSLSSLHFPSLINCRGKRTRKTNQDSSRLSHCNVQGCPQKDINPPSFLSTRRVLDLPLPGRTTVVGRGILRSRPVNHGTGEPVVKESQGVTLGPRGLTIVAGTQEMQS